MPNFKIFQDNPDQTRIKIFGGNNIPVNTDLSGNVGITSTGLTVTGTVDVGTVTITSSALAVTGTVDVGTVTVTSSGLAVTGIVDVGTVTVTSSGLAVTGIVDVGTVTVTSSGLAVTGIVDVGTVTVTSSGLAVTGIVDVGTVTVTSSGLAVTGSVDVGTVTVTSSGLAVTGIVDVGTVTVTSSGLAVTGSVDVSGTVTVTTGSGSLNVCIPDIAGISIEDHGVTDLDETVVTGSAAFSGATPQVILDQNAWTFAVKNISADPNDAVVQIQLSATADDESDWIDETLPVTLSQNEVSFLTSSLLVKYARVYYAAATGGDDVTLSVIFQAQK